MPSAMRTPDPQARLLMLPIERIKAARLKTRNQTSEPQLLALADSIRQHGLLNPILVRVSHGGMYELICGERRLRAMVMIGHTDVPAIVLCASDLEAALISLTENIQREGLHYLEEAQAFQAVIKEHGLSQRELGERIGRSQGMIANRLRLLTLPGSVRTALRSGGFSERHARALLKLPGEGQQLEALRLAKERTLSVRQTEELVLRLRDQPARTVKYQIRDGRVLINTVLESVKQLRSVGIDATGEVYDRGDRIEVVVAWKKHPQISQKRGGNMPI